MVNASKANASVDQDSLGRIAPFAHAPQTAITMASVSITLVNAVKDGLVLTAPSSHALQNVLETDIATMEPASANQVSLESIVLCLHAPHLALETGNANQSETKWLASATKGTRAMTVLRRRAPMTVLEMANALMEFALAKTVGVEKTVPVAAQVMGKDAVETASVSKANATATPAGLDTDAKSELVFMTVLSTDTVTTALVSARKDTEAVTARSHLSLSHANAPSTVFVDACNNAQRFTKPKALGHRMSATQNVHKNAFLSAWRVKCQ